MPKPQTGITKIQNALNINIAFLLSGGYIQKGKAMHGRLTWNQSLVQGVSVLQESKLFSAHIITHYTQFEKQIQLFYVIGQKQYEQTIWMTAKPSKLGAGEILSFVCPLSEKACRVVYMAYGLPAFISRDAYYQFLNKRLYYDCQAESKTQRRNSRFWSLENKLEDEMQLRRAFNYSGKPTKRSMKVKEWQKQRDEIDNNVIYSPSLIKGLSESIHLP